MPTVQISNMGRIRTYSGKIVRGWLNGNGRASKGIGGKTYLVSRLILAAFVGPPADPKMDAGHMDNDKTNDRLSNLQWQTHRDNIKENKSLPTTNNSHDLVKKKCRYRRKGTNAWTIHESVTELSKSLGYKTTGAVSSVANGKRVHSKHEVEFLEEATDMEGEEWRRVPDTQTIRVSNMGRLCYATGVISYGGRNGKYLHYQEHASGESTSVHELVMRAFVGPRPEGNDIDHINSDTTDNRLCNLQYLTHDENVQKANIDHKKRCKTLGTPVLAQRGDEVRRFDSITQAAAVLSEELGYEVKRGTLNYHIDMPHLYLDYQWTSEHTQMEVDEEWRDLTEDVLKIAKRAAHTYTRRMDRCLEDRTKAAERRKRRN